MDRNHDLPIVEDFWDDDEWVHYGVHLGGDEWGPNGEWQGDENPLQEWYYSTDNEYHNQDPDHQRYLLQHTGNFCLKEFVCSENAGRSLQWRQCYWPGSEMHSSQSLGQCCGAEGPEAPI